MKVTYLDHLVLTVKNIEVTTDFYQRILGLEKQIFGDNRVALKFGNQKINLHQAGKEYEPKAQNPAPGSADLCFVTETAIQEAMQQVRNCGVDVEEGPVTRTGATGPITSFYFRDPDLNLIEVCQRVV